VCGITGFLKMRSPFLAREGETIVEAMAQRIHHRGPDDGGVWSDANAGIFFAHRRLSIVDLSPAGHQPMISASGRFVVVFNGEIYNHNTLRKTLTTANAAPNWRGHSDTEVMLAAFEHWGIATALTHFVGMFAIALWDRQARDRIGEKPLYWGQFADTVMFSSELKALKAHPCFHGEIDRNALTLLLRYSYIPAPYSIYRNVHKLKPGTLLRIHTTTLEPVIETYWSACEMAQSGQDNPWHGCDIEAIDELERLLKQSVALQLCADVPVGAFLSGGIDSSVVVALAQTQNNRPVKTFSIGFSEEGYNEAHHAKAVALHLGTEHTELYVSAHEAQAVIPSLSTLYDEPFADSSQIPTFLVSQLARRHVTVSLSGDAGDELFGGYTRYLMGEKLRQKLSLLPLPFRQLLSRSVTTLSPHTWNSILCPVLKIAPRRFQYKNMGEKIYKLADLMLCDETEIYHTLVSHWKKSTIVLGANEPLTNFTKRDAHPHFENFIERGAWLDLVSYLPDDILVKVDRAAMAVSLESRIPMLDHRLIEFSARLPMTLKVRDGVGKWILRQVLYRYVPKSLLDRPKMGFGVPIDSWLRGPLLDWAESLLNEDRLKREGFFDATLIRSKWHEHVSEKTDWHYWLWNILMFESWLEQQ
jgi:asparagine synthase (glutamine-hydrolysing)